MPVYPGGREGIQVAVVSLLAACCAAARAADPPVRVEDLRPGLVATYRDDARPTPVEIVRLEPTIALAWKAGGTAHPRLAAGGGTVRWEGYVNVLRPGAYRFSVTLRGRFRLSVAGKDVLAAEVNDETAARKEGAAHTLEAGVHPLVAEFTRLPGSARVELFWQSSQIRTEPLPFDHLGHLPKRAPAKLGSDARVDHGRFLVEEYGCVHCHRPADGDRLAQGLTTRQGPDLSQVGQRAHPGWLYEWLAAPQKLHATAVMPKLFADDEDGRVERYAVARYLASLGGPVQSGAKQPNPKDVQNSVARGQALFTSVGCVACHLPPGEDPKSETRNLKDNGLMPSARRWDISGLGAKTTPEKLATFLQNPLAVDPSGRMPHMLLQPAEALDLARFLCQAKTPGVEPALTAPPAKEGVFAALKRLEKRPDEQGAFQRLAADAQLLDLGKRLVMDKGCNNCHTVAPGGRPLANVYASAAFDDLKDKRKHGAGCLSGPRGAAPTFALSEPQRQDIRHFLSDGTTGAGSVSPTFSASVDLRRFNCLACHSRDGEGGLSTELTDELRRVERAENAEAVSPPPLTGVGHKLRTPWLRQVLTEAGRARPWMGLRMPQFGAAHVGRLPEALAALEGAEPDDQVRRAALTPAKLEAGRHLVGKSAFGCVSCHDLAGIPNSGTRGPDLAGMNQRVRYDWYLRWLEQPQRMQPGTRMPSVFSGGKSLLEKVLDGSAEAQAEAMWAYLSLGPNLPLPDGLEPPKGLTLTVKDRPVLLRTFMPDAGSRAVAVGYPGGVSLAFDAQTCRLAYAWSGNFLDAGPVWNNRGGAPAKLLGPRFWAAPAGFPWGLSSSDEPPDFAARSRDPAYGAAPPEGQLYTGPRRLHFEGYTTDPAGVPTFRYVLDDGGHTLDVSERPGPLRSPVGVGVARRFALRVPARQGVWLLAGTTTREPRVLDERGDALALDLKTGRASLPGTGRFLVLPQDGERVIVLALAAAPDNGRWLLNRVGGTWQALLALPSAREAGKAEVHLRVWMPYRDEPGLLKELLALK
jgi:cbb3-type cytochrome oxidase cytochrome c subunit